MHVTATVQGYTYDTHRDQRTLMGKISKVTQNLYNVILVSELLKLNEIFLFGGYFSQVYFLLRISEYRGK